jgi:cell division protein FtsA
MSKQSVVSIDIGSSAIHGVIAFYDEKTAKLEIVGANTVACPDGIDAGDVIDIGEALNSIKILIDGLEKSQGTKDSAVFVSVRGQLIKTADQIDGISVTDSLVTEEIIESVKKAVIEKAQITATDTLIQIIPKEYKLDRLKVVPNPLSMDCSYLELNSLIVTGPRSIVSNIKKACLLDSDAPLFYGYYSLGNILASKESKKLGCMLIDLGGMTTGIVVYLNGIVQKILELPVGADLITRDITKKLKTLQAESKRIKETYGAVSEEYREEGEFEYSIGSSKKTAAISDLINIIKPQVDMQLAYIISELKRNKVDISALAGGILLTGGGTNLPGILEAFEKPFDCGVKIATVDTNRISVSQEIADSQIYTTAISTLYNELKSRFSGNSAMPDLPGGKEGGFWNRLLRKVGEIV